MNTYPIKEWPEEERPRERLLKFGPESLSTVHLIAIVLRTGGKGRSAVSLAREIYNRFGSLSAIDDASVAELESITGVGRAKIAQLKACLELGKRLLQEKGTDPMQMPSFRNSRDVYEYYRPRFFGLKKERFICVMLDSKNRVFKEAVVSEGTLTSSPVHPREVFRHAIKDAAASVIFIHNHPSGDPSPSRDDIEITRRLVETGRIIGINVLDHLILTDTTYISLMDQGYIK